MRPHSRHHIHVRVLVIIALILGFQSMASPVASALDVYTEPGKHSLNGRTWLTTSEKYSTTIERCTTKIWGTTVTYKSGSFTVQQE